MQHVNKYFNKFINVSTILYICFKSFPTPFRLPFPYVEYTPVYIRVLRLSYIFRIFIFWVLHAFALLMSIILIKYICFSLYNRFNKTVMTSISRQRLNRYDGIIKYIDNAETHEENATCSICDEMSTFSVSFPCGHAFHHYCAFRWLYLNNTCPNCRESVPFDTSGAATKEYEDAENKRLLHDREDEYNESMRVAANMLNADFDDVIEEPQPPTTPTTQQPIREYVTPPLMEHIKFTRHADDNSEVFKHTLREALNNAIDDAAISAPALRNHIFVHCWIDGFEYTLHEGGTMDEFIEHTEIWSKRRFKEKAQRDINDIKYEEFRLKQYNLYVKDYVESINPAKICGANFKEITREISKLYNTRIKAAGWFNWAGNVGVENGYARRFWQDILNSGRQDTGYFEVRKKLLEVKKRVPQHLQ